MIVIGMDPILVHLGDFAISWHSLFIVVGIVAGVWLTTRLVTKAGLSAEMFYSMVIWAIPGGILGARLVHVIDYWGDLYSLANFGAIFAFWEGGLALWGGILGGTLTAAIYARIKGFKLAGYADPAALGLLLAQAIGRIGDVINGEHISKGTNLSWGVTYTHPGSPSFGLPPSHPAVAYELIMDLLILGILWKLLGRVKPDGSIFLLYLASYSVGRFFLSFLRLDSNTVLLGLNQPQWLSLIVLAIVLPMLLLLWQSSRSKLRA
jgi:phosphatidylglycerol:prolipoprotein diacylglycerol transferase